MYFYPYTLSDKLANKPAGNQNKYTFVIYLPTTRDPMVQLSPDYPHFAIHLRNTPSG